MSRNTLPEKLGRFVFSNRLTMLIVFGLLTLVMVWFALNTRIDAGFNKHLPSNHEYIQTFKKHQEKFGGANRIVVALTSNQGTIFSKEYFDLLRKVTDEIYFVPGVDRSQVTSIWTPNTRYIEIVEDGFVGGNVVPAEFTGTAEDLARVRENIIKSGKLGLLVSEDFSSALVIAELVEIDPQTGEKLDYIEVANYLEEKVRHKYEELGSDIGLKIHIIGFAKVIGDVADGVLNVIFFFVISFLISGALVYFYSQSLKLTVLPMTSSLIAVVWQLGLLRLLGYGIDPMSILVPFLVFAIGVSHGVQMVRSFRSAVFAGLDGRKAAMESFSQLLIPGGAALLTDTIGFVTILLIDIPIIQELAIAASLGVAVILFTNLFLLPLLLSYQHLDSKYKRKILKRRQNTMPIWDRLAQISRTKPSILAILIACLCATLGLQNASKVKIGDLQQGVPELRHSSRYNQDSAIITNRFKIGVDLLTVIAETAPDGVIDYEVMELIDRFAWHMQNIRGVQSVVNLASIAKLSNAAFNEGYPKWQILPRHPAVLAQAISPFEPTTGLLNDDGSVIPITIYLADHKAETIERVIYAAKQFRENNPSEKVQLKLATGNVGVMAAQNEVVSAAQFPILLYVFGAVILLCLITFRSWRAAVCIVLPLALVSVLAYALMYLLGIGLKSNTLPVVALGVGVGVDYGIYLFARMQVYLEKGEFFEDALREALQRTGSAVVFTGATLALGVSTWIFSSLKFQADMGILLTFMFLLNMLGAIFLLPAIARWLFPHHFKGV
ncbi:MAG: MMPL family transporter [Verrucomicrobiae bacterium]|nr:MMPL family transporter [Verrucomicrobiae bacterium]